ncbi:response regulator transcription factor [Streptomyces sp. cg36]|uniref:response regulator transcription factor n=1 Tax=Streptomyces sp. cg36 TaxID=3238798 RepID=UPI0034E24A8E
MTTPAALPDASPDAPPDASPPAPAPGPGPAPAPAPAPAFTARERELLGHLAQGATDRAIARRMALSPHTVDTYLRRLRSKTGTSNRVQLAIVAHTALHPAR